MGSKEMTKDVKEVIDKGDLLDSGKEGEDGVENTLEETSVVGSAGWENEAKRSEDVVEEKQEQEQEAKKKVEEEYGNGSKEEQEEEETNKKVESEREKSEIECVGKIKTEKKEEEEETKVDMNKKVEPEIETSEMECVGEIKEEKETLHATGGQFELVTKDETTDEKTGESKNGTEVKTGTAEKILNRREGECGEIGPEEDIGAEEEDTTELRKEENADNARSELPSAEETDPAETSSDQIEPKSGDGGLDKLHKLEPIWMKR